MKFCGIQKTSLLDYPNRVCSVLFTPGCNLRCPFCHNWRIVLDPKPPFLNEENALKILEERKKYIDSVVITGGEPTIHKELPKFLKKLKEKGFKVKLDTNGLDSKMLEACLPYLDYVAVDVKTSPQKYALLGAKEPSALARTVEMLKISKVEYEVRTTVVPGFVDAADIQAMCKIVKGAMTWALQQFVPGDTLDSDLNNVKPYSLEILSKYAETIKDYAERIVLRT
jgi:pyruvate formate lyase activating enzyme